MYTEAKVNDHQPTQNLLETQGAMYMANGIEKESEVKWIISTN